MASPTFTINGSATTTSVSVAPGGAVVATLTSTVGVNTCAWTLIRTDDTSATTDYALAISGAKNETCTTTALTAGKAAVLKCTINGGIDTQTGQPSTACTATGKFFVPTSVGLEVCCADEQNDENVESSSTHGMIKPFNAVVRAASRSWGDWKESAVFVRLAALPAYTRSGNVVTASANGAFPVTDGVTPLPDMRMLYAPTPAHADAGIYVFTAVGDGGSPFVLTRSDDCDTSAKVTDAMRVPIEQGTAYKETCFQLETTNPITLNTTPLSFRFAGALMLVTTALEGTVNAFGATVNTVLQSDGSTPGGVWQDHLDLGTSPATGGDVRLSPDGCIVINDGAGADLYVIAHSSAIGTVYMGTPDADVEVIGGDHLKLVTDADGTVVDIAGGVALDFPSAVDVTFSGNPTVDAGMGQWWMDKLDIGTALTVDAAGYLGFGTAPGSGATAMASAGTLRLPKAFDWNIRRTGDAADADLISSADGESIAIGSLATLAGTITIDSFTAVTLRSGLGGQASFGADGMRLDHNTICFHQVIAAPSIYQKVDTTAGVTGDVFTVHAQDVNSAGAAATGGQYFTRGGDGLGANDIGGDWVARAGHGVAGHANLKLQDSAGTDRLIIHEDSQVSILALVASDWQVGGVNVWASDGTHCETEHTHVLFDESVVAPIIAHSPNATQDVTVGDTTVAAGSVTAASGTAYCGNLGLKGGTPSGSATNKYGNVWLHVSPGVLANWQSAEKVLAVADAVTLPTTGLANFVFLYSHTGHLECVDHDGVTHLLG